VSRLLQDKVQWSCDACWLDDGASGDVLRRLTAASVHASAAESDLRDMVEALTTTAPAALHGPQHTDDDASTAAAAAAGVAGGGGGSGDEMDFVDASPDGLAAEVAAADSDVSAAAPPQPSYRLVSRSGQQPTHQPPAALRLSPDELANVFGFYHPWELTHRRRVLGKALFDAAAANYTQLTIDGSAEGGVRQLWERMPLATAHKWGQRAIHLTHLHLTRPRAYSRCWCGGIWVSIIEGNAAAHKAISDKEKKRQHEGGEEGTARPAHHVPQPASSIKVISFDDDHDGGFRGFRYDISADPLPPSPSPIDLSHLEEVHSLPYQYAAVRTGGRVWYTPRLRVLTLVEEWGYGVEDMEGSHSRWMGACEHLEKFDVDTTLLSVKQGLLSTAPKDGKSLSRLQSIGPINLRGAGSETVAELRETLVSRGCRHNLRELHIETDDASDKELLLEVGRLVEAVMQPEALDQLTVTKAGGVSLKIDMELIGWAADTSRQVQKLVLGLAAIADEVRYSGGEVTSAISAAQPTVFPIFPLAHTFTCTTSLAEQQGDEEMEMGEGADDGGWEGDGWEKEAEHGSVSGWGGTWAEEEQQQERDEHERGEEGLTNSFGGDGPGDINGEELTYPMDDYDEFGYDWTASSPAPTHSHATQPRAHSQETLDSLVKAVTKQMPKCRHIRLRRSDDAVYFLKALKGQLGSSEGSGGDERVSENLTVTIDISPDDILQYGDGLQQWASHDLPAIQGVTIDFTGDLPDGATNDDLFLWLLWVLAVIIPVVPEVTLEPNDIVTVSQLNTFCAVLHVFYFPHIMETSMRFDDGRTIIEKSS